MQLACVHSFLFLPEMEAFVSLKYLVKDLLTARLTKITKCKCKINIIESETESSIMRFTMNAVINSFLTSCVQVHQVSVHDWGRDREIHPVEV